MLLWRSAILPSNKSSYSMPLCRSACIHRPRPLLEDSNADRFRSQNHTRGFQLYGQQHNTKACLDAVVPLFRVHLCTLLQARMLSLEQDHSRRKPNRTRSFCTYSSQKQVLHITVTNTTLTFAPTLLEHFATTCSSVYAPSNFVTVNVGRSLLTRCQ